MALNAKPNPAHYALAELSRRRPQFLTLSQNVDGLSPRAGHPREQLKLLHGNLFDVKCEDESCTYFRENDFTDPIVPALAIPEDETSIATDSEAGPNKALQAAVARKSALVKGLDISDAQIPLPSIPRRFLPQCPNCETSLLRPAVVWFGEPLPDSVIRDINAYFYDVESELDGDRVQSRITKGQSPTKKIDLCLVIGTSSRIYPAAGYAAQARQLGARVAVVNIDRSDALDLREGDWFFEGDAAEIVPEILKSVIGEVQGPKD